MGFPGGGEEYIQILQFYCCIADPFYRIALQLDIQMDRPVKISGIILPEGDMMHHSHFTEYGFVFA